MKRLLVLAELVCGAAARVRVFEPLVADWQRQRADASHRSRAERARVVVSGGMAFGLSLSRCAMTRALSLPPGRALARGAAVFAGAALIAIAVDAFITAVSTSGRYPVDILVRYIAAPMAMPVAIPLAMLPLMMVLRRDSRATRWHAVQFLVMGAVLAALGASASRPPAFNRFTPEEEERMYHRALANDRAGRLEYPGTAYRQLHPTTATQRAEQRAVFEKRMAGRDPFPRAAGSWPRRVHTALRAPVLALAFGVMGWTLAALGRARLSHAVLWWMLAWAAMLLMDGRPYVRGYSSAFVRMPYWMPTLVFVTTAIALQVASARMHRAPDPRHP
jgi:hypothetical protein